jgi:hypothetical protein
LAALIPNIAKGKFAYYAGLPAANDALVWVVFTGTETDDNLRDATTLTAIIALAVDEATFTGYSRKVQTTAAVTVDNTNNWVLVDDTTDPSWSPTSAQAVTRIGCFYDPDTTGGTDADLIPLFIDDFALTTATSGTLTYTVATGGFGKSA